MNTAEVAIRFLPDARTATLPQGMTVREAAARAGIAIDYPCGGQGSCGKCKVRFADAPPAPSEAASKRLSRRELEHGIRLACQTRVYQSATIEVLEQSRLKAKYQILTHSGNPYRHAIDPLLVTQPFALSAPTLKDDLPDVERLERELGPLVLSHSMLEELPGKLRAFDFHGEAVLLGDRLLDVVPEDGKTPCLSAAFDIGTTTLVGVLHDPAADKDRASAARLNPQTAVGEDVLSRILYAGQNRESLAQLQGSVITAVNEMIEELCKRAGVSRDAIYEVVFSGNTTMEHLLAGISPASLGVLPFVSVFSNAIALDAAEVGVQIHPRGRVYLFPIIGGFVGGDTVSGILATGLTDSSGPTMLVDIGTNGEVALFAGGQMTATSCAAGPAFEGARISNGMRAAPGAIEYIACEDDVRFQVIGAETPVGLCGSGLIDGVAELLRLGLLVPQGLLLTAEQAPAEVSSALRNRLEETADGVRFVIAWPEETYTGEPIAITQRDIRELQLAIGAIRAGIAIMLRNAGLEATDLERLLVAGGFGNYIRCENAQRIGLLPEQVDPGRIVFVGNSSLAGARHVITSKRARASCQEIARQTRHVDLSLDPAFQEEFAEAMFFPSSMDQSVVR